MTETIASYSLPEYLTKAENLPTPPAVAMEVLRLTADEGVCLDDLAKVIIRDPALSSRILKLSNSSLFRRGSEVTTIDRATMLLGMKTVKLMALSFSLASGMPRDDGGRSSFNFDAYWRHSLTTSVAARSLALLVRSRHSEEAFLCGLMSRIGQLAMAFAALSHYRPVLERSSEELPTAEDEHRILGTDHHAIGAALLQSWGLPTALHAAIYWSRDPDALPADEPAAVRDLARLLQLAQLATTVLCDTRKGPALRSLEELASSRHGIASKEMEAFLIGLKSGINETAALLSVEVDRAACYQTILDQARAQIVQVSLGTALDLQQTANRAQELERERNELAEKVTTDKLTGIRNRAYFDETLRKVVHRRSEGDTIGALGLLVLDVDRFKLFNDTHGHAVGDEVLKHVAKLMSGSTRGSDSCARYGGEEFVVILPETDLKVMGRVAERIRKVIEETPVVVAGKSLSVTVSIGGAACADIGSIEEAESLLKLADENLYRAKKDGRNRSVCEIVERPV